MSKNQKGFAFIELVLVLVVVGAIGFVGMKVYQMHQDRANKASETTTSNITQKTGESSNAAPATLVPDVTKKSDLDAASAALDQNDNSADTSDQAALNGQENDF